MPMRLMFIGDVVGKAGRRAVRELLPGLRQELELDAVVANGENLAAGNGITKPTGQELFQAGVDLLTGGNHTFDRREGYDYIRNESRLVRPANYPPGTPGRTLALHTTRAGVLAVGCVLGRVFMQPLADPFRTADTLVDEARRSGARFILIDVHAEATSEKVAMGWHLDGRASLVAGTHTHIPTADQRVLPGGTGYVTDVGMTGPYDSVIGMEKEGILTRFLTGLPQRFQTATGDIRLYAVLVELDEKTGRALSMERIERSLEEDKR